MVAIAKEEYIKFILPSIDGYFYARKWRVVIFMFWFWRLMSTVTSL